MSTEHPCAIAMWDSRWLERRWPGAGYEDWDLALNGPAERGYDALRNDAYPHNAQRPVFITVGWAVVHYKDWSGLDWDGVLDLNARAVEHAVGTGPWTGICTSNFCRPHFRGVWREVGYHQHLTSLIKSASIAEDLREPALVRQPHD